MNSPTLLLMVAQLAVVAPTEHRLPSWSIRVAAQPAVVVVAVHRSMLRPHQAAAPPVAAVAALHKVVVLLVAAAVAQLHRLLCFRLPASAQSMNLLAASLAACQEDVPTEPTVLGALVGPSCPHRSPRSWPSCLADRIPYQNLLQLFGLCEMQMASLTAGSKIQARSFVLPDSTALRRCATYSKLISGLRPGCSLHHSVYKCSELS